MVTEFEFALHEVGPLIQFGFLFWSLDQGGDMLRHARDVIDALPEDVNIMVGALNAPPAPFVPEQHQLQPGYAAIVVGREAAEHHAEAVAAMQGGPQPLVSFATPMPYVELQKMLDEANAWGLHAYDKGCYVDTLSDDVIEAVTTQCPARPRLCRSCCSIDSTRRSRACLRTPPPSAGGGHRGSRSFVIGVCPVPEMLPAERDWVRAAAEALQPVSTDDGFYVNGVTDFDARDRSRGHTAPRSTPGSWRSAQARP